MGGSHTCYFKQSVTVHGSSPEHMEEVWARTQDHHLCDSILFSAMTAVSRVIEFVRNIFRIQQQFGLFPVLVISSSPVQAQWIVVGWQFFFRYILYEQ